MEPTTAPRPAPAAAPPSAGRTVAARTVLTWCLVLGAARVGGAFDPSGVLVVLPVALYPACLLLVPPHELPAHGLRRPRGAWAVAQGTAVVALAYAVPVGLCHVVLGTGDDNWVTWLPRLFEHLAPGRPRLALVLMVVCMGLLVPVAEEVFFRGVVHTVAVRRHGPVAGVLLVAAGWALVHTGDYGLRPFDPVVLAGMLPSVLLMGLALGWCRQRTGSVPACVAAQSFCNLLLLAWAVTR